ncbi:MAG: DUF262 domain-containing protein [Roseofilum sp. Belize BBD 4]|uniref:DUF262 domain-containing protein n=1 Tax=Roseofilum sp. Belize BBD 4 TaxID=2821500 RepID=UPI000E9A4DB3|nr:DUF262 domain-containing HNH endonuclease family protein [Roseofilum sp. Belize BBD 4]MBP0034013.1 DUF262 domain-containing protein [Roseofilum sp. Belize BBD 4]HBQ98457.1 DUF262 domain-containing protein [Cyanobacteria bacterium UBA11691]
MDISRIFQTSSQPISSFFNEGVGYYIPRYQRDYSWEKENIEQLMYDICSGVFELQSNHEQIHFMGTLILVGEYDKEKNITPKDSKALPKNIDNVIDGQQRISTIALLACCLYKSIHRLRKKIVANREEYEDQLEQLQDAFDSHLDKLTKLFSFDLTRGIPKRKPIIIRQDKDRWTLDGNAKEHYTSEAHISLYLAEFIDAIQNEPVDFHDYPKPKKGSVVAEKIEIIDDYLETVKESHKNDANNYPSAWDILSKIAQSEFWNYDRPELTEIINGFKEVPSEELKEIQNCICSLVQVFAFSSYLLERCCFTVIRPTSQIRAFDMFQSLNATGTPLTAIETFKPLVVHVADVKSQEFRNSNFDKSLTKIEDLTRLQQNASAKNARTNDYLTLFSLTYEGKAVPKQFSIQRKWLIDKFQKSCSSIDGQDPSLEDQEKFMEQMGIVAEYYKKIIIPKNKTGNQSLPELNLISDSERKIAFFCLVYLNDANHKMAHTVLSRFYSLTVYHNGRDDEQQKKFAIACKVIAAFFTLWRSALPNTGLDATYRQLLYDKISWQKGDSQLSLDVLKNHCQEALAEKQIGTQVSWKQKAMSYLRYDNNIQKVCKFALMITAHNTIPDPDETGLMKIGRSESSPDYQDSERWKKDCKTIEHIAPQNPDLGSWDQDLYSNDGDYQKIGNLTLLPTNINSSASNKSWIEKWIYYSHLAETNLDELSKLKNIAQEKGVELNSETIKSLKEARYAHHIKPIVQVGQTGKWDKELVQKRTERICDILWKRMNQWLTE